MPTFQEVIHLTRQLSAELGREIGIYPETKHPTYFASIGRPLEPKLVETLNRNGLNRPESRVFVQSFETANLRALRGQLRGAVHRQPGHRRRGPRPMPPAEVLLSTPTDRSPY